MSETLMTPGFVWPGLAEVLAVLTLQGGYNTSVVLVGVSLLGAAAGVVGTFAVLRRRALMSDTLSHATLPGICLAFLARRRRSALDARSLPRAARRRHRLGRRRHADRAGGGALHAAARGRGDGRGAERVLRPAASCC